MSSMYKKETLLHAEPFHFCVCSTSYVINTINWKLSPSNTQKKKKQQKNISHQWVNFINGFMGCCHKYFLHRSGGVQPGHIAVGVAAEPEQTVTLNHEKRTPCSRRWSSTHFWIACSISYSRAVCFVFWPLPRPLSLRGQPHSWNTGESQERHALKSVPLLELGQPWRGRGEEIENTCVQRKCKV